MEPKTEQTPKMPFNKYWESVVGKVSKIKEEIQAKEEELTEFLLEIIQKYGVVPEDSETPTQEKKVEHALEGEMVELKVTVFKPYIDFMKEYLAFFGSKQTIEDLCRTMIYDDVKNLNSALNQWIESEVSHIEKEAWFNKHSFLACASSPEDKEE